MGPRFFPYHPLKWRLLVGAGAVLLAAAMAACLWLYVRAPSLRWEVMAGACGGLTLALARVVIRLGPRPGWGVTLDEAGLTVAKLTRGEAQARWSEVRETVLGGEKRQVLAVRLTDGRQVLVPAHLFSREAAFREVVAAVEEAGRRR